MWIKSHVFVAPRHNKVNVKNNFKVAPHYKFFFINTTHTHNENHTLYFCFVYARDMMIIILFLLVIKGVVVIINNDKNFFFIDITRMREGWTHRLLYLILIHRKNLFPFFRWPILFGRALWYFHFVKSSHKSSLFRRRVNFALADVRAVLKDAHGERERDGRESIQ